MRADRLIALLLLLQQRDQITAKQAAEELEVSERTARRDLEALAMGGVPVYSSAGRGGGWRLLGGAKTDLTGLSLDEARALFLAAGPATGASPELTSALRKLTGALPATFRADAEAAAGAIKIDPTGWGQLGLATPPHLAELTDSVVAGRQVKIGYLGRDGRRSTRTVSPLGLVTKGNVWYLVANTDNGMRTFRVGRISALDPQTEATVRPMDFDLEAEWDRIVSEVEAKRPEYEVEVLVDPSMVRPLRFQFAGRITFDQEHPDGRFSVRIREFGPRPLAAQLVGYGAAVDVVDPPPELAAEFVRLAEELRDRWLDPAAT